ncbi:hypothetical protein Tco_1504410 [Tanacetum coccineum]
MTNLTDMLSKFVNSNTASTSGSGTLPSNTHYKNPKGRFEGVYHRSVLLTSALMPNLKPSIPYPSRRNDERRHEKANDQIEKFSEIFKDLSF